MRHAAALLLTAICCLVGCRDKSAPAPAVSVSAPVVPAELGVRPEVVARADELAVRGSRLGGEQGAALTFDAAELRRRLWRVERREADALEATELYRSVEAAGGELACEASVSRALLEGELRNDPSETYRALHRARVKAGKGECFERAGRALEALAAFRPLPNVLAELEREALGAERASEASPVASVRLDPAGPVVVPTFAASAPPGPVRITSVERYGAEQAARIVVFVSAPTTFDVGFIGRQGTDRGPRLFVDIDQASYKGPLSFDVGGLVQRVRVGKHKKATRIVLDLESDAYRKVFYLPEPFRLVIDVSKEAPAAQAAPTEAGPRSVKRVVLDPGHGGHDPGAVGPGGLREKDVTLDVAHRAAPIIARELGVVTLLTRDSDDFVPLDERAARANAFKADLFVSIHCNANEDGHGRGVMTFVLDESREQVALAIAARENAASTAAAAELAGAMSQVVDVTTRARSLHFAELLQRASMASLTPDYPDVSDRGVKRAGFYVLAGARMPAVLYETSFISHTTEETRLNTGAYRQKLADAIVNAVRAYREGR